MVSISTDITVTKLTIVVIVGTKRSIHPDILFCDKAGYDSNSKSYN